MVAQQLYDRFTLKKFNVKLSLFLNTINENKFNKIKVTITNRVIIKTSNPVKKLDVQLSDGIFSVFNDTFHNNWTNIADKS